MMLKRAGVKLEADAATVARTDLEPADIAAGAQVDANTKHGLYLYTAGERLDAANYLFGYLHDKVRDQQGEKGIFGELSETFSDIADDVANQMVNAFASDFCDTEAKESEEWKNTVASNAVSPDNILLWDSPAARGFYGFAAPLVYHEPRREVITGRLNRRRRQACPLHVAARDDDERSSVRPTAGTTARYADLCSLGGGRAGTAHG